MSASSDLNSPNQSRQDACPSKKTMSPETAAETPTPVNSPGAAIRDARNRARMSLEELAAATKLARGTLEALERDDFNALLEPVYVRGYYRKCAKILNLSEKDLVETYNARVTPKRPDPPSKLRLASGTEIGSGNPLPLPMAIAAAFAAILVSIAIWNFFRSPEPAIPVPVPVTETDAASEGTADSASADTVPGSEPAALDMAAVVAPAAGVTGPETAPAPAAEGSVAPVTAPPASPAAATPAAVESNAPLTLNFAITSWARVDDATGKTLLNGLMRTGERQVLRGKAPYSVFLGNAPGVRIDYEGRNIEFSQHVADNLTARFKVPEGSN